MNPFRKAVYFALLLLLLAWPTLPQQSGCGKKLLPVFVTEKDGGMVTTLTSADLKLGSRSGSMSAVGLKHDDRRRRIIIMLDASASMHGLVGSPLWPVAMALTRHAVNASSENSDLAFVLFSDHVLESVGFSRDKAALQQKIDEVAKNPAYPMPRKADDSRIYDILKEQALKLENSTSADSFLFITDGTDEGSKANPNQIMDVLSRSTIRVFTILVDPIQGQQSSVGPDAFVRFVKRSGGKVFGPINSDNPAFRQTTKTAEAQKALEGRLREFYRGMFENDALIIEVPPTTQKPETVELSLTDSARQRLKKPEIQFPHEVGPCSPVKTLNSSTPD